jgi:hypothetical protein
MMLRKYHITIAQIKEGKNKFYYLPKDNNDLEEVVKNNYPFATVLCHALSLREAKAVARRALEKEMSDG